jgi:23S rRNA pseudouridine955/2504/2580 synthase
MRTLKITRNDAGQRLDKFLSKTLSRLPASLMYKYIRTKRIKVNNARCEQGYILAEGDEVQLYIKDEFFGTPERNSMTLGSIVPKLSIIYEDDNIMLLNKRPGVLVHEDAGGSGNTLILHIQAYLYQKGEYDPGAEQSCAPALCNRIDRNTGGIVIAAKNAAALREMNERIRRGEVGKFYICAVHGRPPRTAATLRGWLKKDSERNIVTVSDTKIPGGREIITKYRVITSRGGASLLEVELITGRTHQIRAQLSHIGCPLLGEGKYAKNREDKKKGYKHQALYAWCIRFDFAGDYDGILKYLRGREFSLPEEDIWFLKDFA